MCASERVVVGALNLERARVALNGELASIVYTDPPWGPGLLTYFHTIAGKSPEEDWPAFLDTLGGVIVSSVRPGGHVFIEMGVDWIEDLAAAMEGVGLEESARWVVQYGSPKRPSLVWYSGPGVEGCDPTGMSGVAMTRHVLESVREPGALVFDPCCGKGMTARCAVRLGMRFAGVELNAKRAQVTKDWLARNVK